MLHKCGLTKSQIQANREDIQQMWKHIPEAWIELNVVLFAHDPEYSDKLLYREDIANQCRGTNNTCSAVGCFMGWNLTNANYQDWCRKYRLSMGMSESLNCWLGLPPEHGLFHPREQNDCTQYQEVQNRLQRMMNMPIYIDGVRQ